jgi:8-oxo-dGTP diphosphatase
MEFSARFPWSKLDYWEKWASVASNPLASLRASGLASSMSGLTLGMPYKIATLVYCFNERDEILLLERAQEPNLGLWSPCGGKLHTDEGESPYACACREALEELGLQISASDLHLTGLVSEHGYLGESHWLMFLFEMTTRPVALPRPHREGRFAFFPREALASLKLPQTDREKIWPLFWQHRGGFFAAHCHCGSNGQNTWTLEESVGGSMSREQKRGKDGR